MEFKVKLTVYHLACITIALFRTSGSIDLDNGISFATQKSYYKQNIASKC